MKDITETAREYLEYNLSVIPTKEDKAPALPSWKKYQETKLPPEELYNIFNRDTAKGIGVVCGKVSGGLEVIDVDTKYDITGNLWKDLKGYLEDNILDLFKKFVIAQTKSGGYHIYYRCNTIAGNLKLANRNTTLEEIGETYKTELKKGATELEAKTRSINDKTRVLIETRGEGGYVIAPPSKGYEYIQGNLENIPNITPAEREIILNIAKSFNELEQPTEKIKTISSIVYSNLSPFEDYNDRGDIIALLESKGWKVVNTSGDRVNLLRAGSTDSKTSGNYHKEKKVLRVFSSSTEFNTEKGYSPAMVFSLLECSGDDKLAYKKLLELGYGEPYKSGKEIKLNLVKIAGVTQVNKESSVIPTVEGKLTSEIIKSIIGNEITIITPELTAPDEVIRVIDFLQEETKFNKSIYIKAGDTELRDYRYKLNLLFKKYSNIEGGLQDRDVDNFLKEAVVIATFLSPIDKDIFIKDLVSVEAIAQLGITANSLDITIDKIKATRDKEKQASNFNKLMKEANSLFTSGDVSNAIDLLTERLSSVKLEDKATEFNNLIKPTNEEEIIQRLEKTPNSLLSGLSIDNEPLLLPAGAITTIALPTSHGKTTILLNLAVNIANSDNLDEVYYFSYEEDRDTLIQKALNCYISEDISSNNLQSINSYFKTSSLEMIKTDKRDIFTAKKESFFNSLIHTRKLNIIYSNYNSDTLIEAIRYIHKTAKPTAIFIDYIQLLNTPSGKYKTYSRQEELKQICIALKDLAVESGLPIILGAQFNREVVNHLTIHASKIGEAGDIERIANLIIGGWNNNFEIQATDKEKKEIEAKNIQGINTVYLKILKQRGGKVGGSDVLTFSGANNKVSNIPSNKPTSFKKALF